MNNVKQLELAINALTYSQKEILKRIYAFPDSSATAKQLAKELGYEDYRAANLQVGKIGKSISQFCGTEPIDRKNGKPIYHLFVGNYSESKGWEMWEEIQEALRNLKLVDTNETLPTETNENEKEFFREGKLVSVYVNRYERNQDARKECLDHHGYTCKGCGLNFSDMYGEIAAFFIHVHHKKPLHQIKKDYSLDPVNDLVPLCANCHSVVHMRTPDPLTVEELREIIDKNRSKR